MRRTFALLALLATSWPHAVALECALASAASATAEVSPHGAHGHPGAHAGMTHGRTPHSRAASDGSAPPGGPDCAMVMACGLVMIQTEGEATSMWRVSGPDTGRFPSVDTPSTADLVADPPPPRRNA
jgi:hypothetical protein